jgi:type VI secretion system protein VasD
VGARSIMLTLLLAVAGCAGAPPAQPPPPLPPPAVLQAAIVGAQDLNPDLKGRPSPVVLRVFELKAPAGFQAADFFSLFGRAGDVLGNDLVATHDLTITPNDHRPLERQLSPDTRFIGLVAGYREYEVATWRTLIPVSPNATTRLPIVLRARAIQAGEK